MGIGFVRLMVLDVSVLPDSKYDVCLRLRKDSEEFRFRYNHSSSDTAALLRTLGNYASDKELSFTWYDAAVLSQKVRKLREEEEKRVVNNRLEHMF